MDIKPEISSVSIYTEETVRFKTSEARTKIRVKDGQTVIIGGLVKNEETLGRRRVPFISRIPIIGIPFRAKYDTGIQSELVVFLTPKILKVENMENRLSIQAQELQRSNEAKAKEEEMTEKFGNGYEWHKKPPTNINEDKSRAKKFFKEALKLDRKARRLKGERSEKIYKISILKYKELIDTYPDSKYTPEAMYNKAMIHEKLTDHEMAVMILTTITELYPHENIYRKATKKLKKLTEY